MYSNRNKWTEKIEVDDQHLTLRIVLFVTFVFISLFFLYKGVAGFLGGTTGWQEISANTLYDAEFQFCYDASSVSERKAVYTLYRSTTQEAYELYDDTNTYDDAINLAYLSAHPNEEIEIDAELYDSLSKVLKHGNLLYMAPIASIYAGILSCSEDYQTVDFDPEQNEIVKDYLDQLLSYIQNGDIQLKLLNDSKVELIVSDEYLSYLNENGVASLISFGWMKNAAMIDYIESTFIQAGYTKGFLVSYDGFGACFQDCDQVLSQGFYVDGKRILDWSVSTNDHFASMSNAGHSELSDADFYQFEDGHVVSRYINSLGNCETSYDAIMMDSLDMSCLDLALNLYEINLEGQDLLLQNYVTSKDHIVDTDLSYETLLEGYTRGK